MRSKSMVVRNVVLLFVVVVLINLVASKFYFRLDLSEDQRYTLSNATKDILEDLAEPVTVTAYFGEGLPPRYANLKDELFRPFGGILLTLWWNGPIRIHRPH